MKSNTMYKSAAVVVAISGVMHAVGIFLGRFSSDVLMLAVPLVVYLLLAYMLQQGKRWAAWLTFVCMLVGMTAALMGTYGNGYAPNWVFYSIAIFDIIAAIILFGVLWKSRDPAVAATR